MSHQWDGNGPSFSQRAHPSPHPKLRLPHPLRFSKRGLPRTIARPTVSFNPTALVTATRVERRGFPWIDKARYRLSRSMPAALATLAYAALNLELCKTLVKPPLHPSSAHPADSNPTINFGNVAQLPLSACYSRYSNQITLKSAAIAALFVFLGPIPCPCPKKL